MSKKLSREAMAAYQKDRRARLRAAAKSVKPLESVKPRQNVKPASQAPLKPLVATAVPGICPNCERLAADLEQQKQESTRLLARIAALEAQVKRHDTSDQPPKGNDLEALQKRVIAAKVDRFNNYGRNPVIGRAAL